MSNGDVEFKTGADKLSEKRAPDEHHGALISELLKEMKEWLNDDKRNLEKGKQIATSLRNTLAKARAYLNSEGGIYNLYYDASSQLGIFEECIRKIEEQERQKIVK